MTMGAKPPTVVAPKGVTGNLSSGPKAVGMSKAGEEYAEGALHQKRPPHIANQEALNRLPRPPHLHRADSLTRMPRPPHLTWAESFGGQVTDNPGEKVAFDTPITDAPASVAPPAPITPPKPPPTPPGRKTYDGRPIRMQYGVRSHTNGRFGGMGVGKSTKLAMDAAGIGGLAALGGIGLVGGYGAVKAPEGHRTEGAYRAVSHAGHTLAGVGSGAVLGAQAGNAVGGTPAAVAGAGVGAVTGGLAGDSLWNWTMPQPTWERDKPEKEATFTPPRDPFRAPTAWEGDVRSLRRQYGYLGKGGGEEGKTYTLEQAKKVLEANGECGCEKEACVHKEARQVVKPKVKKLPSMGAGVKPSAGSSVSIDSRYRVAAKGSPFLARRERGEGEAVAVSSVSKPDARDPIAGLKGKPLR